MKRANRNLFVIFAFALVLVATSCERKSPESSEEPATPAGTSTPERADDEPQEPKEAERASWESVPESELDESGSELLGKARAAQKQLGSQLKEALTSSVSEDGFDGAVDFCHEQAPRLAESVADETGVEIGRTSHRLRNPDNAPPAWAADTVAAKEPGPHVFRGPDDRLGYLHPIKLGGLCVNCHGETDQLAPGVSDMLAKHYPKDQATGFEVGDLRGWFWVEVSPTESQ